jgi:hypothetical protein
MVEESRQAETITEHPLVRYEKTDVNFRWIVGLILGAIVFVALVQYVVLVFVEDYKEYQAEVKKSPYPLAPGPSNVLPTEPRLEQIDRLEGFQRGDVYEREMSKEAILNSYGPTSDQGFIHIPIERVLTLGLLKDRLPARGEPAAGARRRERGLVGSGESNSGRSLQESR